MADSKTKLYKNDMISENTEITGSIETAPQDLTHGSAQETHGRMARKSPFCWSFKKSFLRTFLGKKVSRYVTMR